MENNGLLQIYFWVNRISKSILFLKLLLPARVTLPRERIRAAARESPNFFSTLKDTRNSGGCFKRKIMGFYLVFSSVLCCSTFFIHICIFLCNILEDYYLQNLYLSLNHKIFDCLI